MICRILCPVLSSKSGCMLEVRQSMSNEHERPVSDPVRVIAEGMSIGVVGAGVMGQTLIRGLLSGNLVPHARVWAGDKNSATCEAAAAQLGIPVESDFQERVPTTDLILVC